MLHVEVFRFLSFLLKRNPGVKTLLGLDVTPQPYGVVPVGLTFSPFRDELLGSVKGLCLL